MSALPSACCLVKFRLEHKGVSAERVRSLKRQHGAAPFYCKQRPALICKQR